MNTDLIYLNTYRKLRKWGWLQKQRYDLNKKRYRIYTGTYNVLLIYKNEWLLKFGDMFEGASGIGDSINWEDFKKARDVHGCELIIRIAGSEIFATSLTKFAEEDTDSRPKFMRKNKEGKVLLCNSIHKFINTNEFPDCNSKIHLIYKRLCMIEQKPLEVYL